MRRRPPPLPLPLAAIVMIAACGPAAPKDPAGALTSAAPTTPSNVAALDMPGPARARARKKP